MKQFIITALILLLGTQLFAQKKLHIDLSNSSINNTPKNFYIKHVVDRRDNTAQIGTISEGIIDLKYGTELSLTNFMQQRISWSNSDFPIIMQVKTMNITEKDMGSKRQFELDVSFVYYSNNNKLIEYRGNGYVQTNGGYEEAIKKLILGNLEDNLKRFDAWVGKNKSTITAEPSVNINVVLADRASKPNHISYSKNRRLYTSDFQGEPDMSIDGAAGTFSGIGMSYNTLIKLNQTTVDVTLYVYFDTRQSWMKAEGKNSTVLNHEQRHFDLTALKACELKKRIKDTHFSPDTYGQQLDDLLNTIKEEASELQEQYDEETQHGTLIDIQEAWNLKIDKMLKQQNCH